MRSVNVRLSIGLLVACNLVSIVDRSVVNLFVDPIRRSLGLSDFQISLVQGPAFGIIYILATLPFGRLADLGNRKTVIACAAAIWSLGTAATGVTWSFATIIIARAFVGGGEAGLTPPTYSLLADLVDKRRLGRSIGLFTMAGMVGIGFAMLGGGAFVSLLGTQGVVVPGYGVLQPWRVVFIANGVVGLILSLLVLRFVVEPSRSSVELITPFRSVLSCIWRERSFYVPVYVGYAAVAVANYGFLSWIPTYFLRTYDLPLPSVGVRLGAIFTVANILGPLMGGWFTDRLYGRVGSVGAIIMMRICFTALIPATLLMFVGHFLMPALVGCGLAAFVISALLALGPTAIQMVAPSRMRGQLGAILMLCANLFGLGTGPVIVAALSHASFVPGLGGALAFHIIIFACVGLFASVAARLTSRDAALETLK